MFFCVLVVLKPYNSFYGDVVAWTNPLKAFKAMPISAEPLHRHWMKSALHPSSGPPTDASCSCTLLPVCILSLLSAERCHSNVGTPAEFKSGPSEWSSAGMLAGCSDFHGLRILAAQRPAALDLSDSRTVKQTGELTMPCLCVALCCARLTCFNKARVVQHTVYAMRRKQPLWWVALIRSPGGCLWLKVISTQASAPAARQSRNLKAELVCSVAGHVGFMVSQQRWPSEG